MYSPSRTFKSNKRQVETLHQDQAPNLATATTRDRWEFFPYTILRRGDRNVPTRYLKNARWLTDRSTPGYYVQTSGPSGFYPVEFNFEHTCWCEITWNAQARAWDVLRPTRAAYGCDIATNKKYQEAFGATSTEKQKTAANRQPGHRHHRPTAKTQGQSTTRRVK